MALHMEKKEVDVSVDFGSSKTLATFRLKGEDGEPEVLTYPPGAVVPNNRKAHDELVATVLVSSKEKDPGYTVSELCGELDTAVFTSLKLSLDISSEAEPYNKRFSEQLEKLNLKRRSAGFSEVTRDKLLQAPFNRIFKRIREVIKERYPSCDKLTIRLRVGHPVHWSVASKCKLREVATTAGKEEGIDGIDLTVSLFNEARAALARLIDLGLVKISQH